MPQANAQLFNQINNADNDVRRHAALLAIVNAGANANYNDYKEAFKRAVYEHREYWAFKGVTIPAAINADARIAHADNAWLQHNDTHNGGLGGMGGNNRSFLQLQHAATRQFVELTLKQAHENYPANQAEAIQTFQSILNANDQDTLKNALRGAHSQVIFGGVDLSQSYFYPNDRTTTAVGGDDPRSIVREADRQAYQDLAAKQLFDIKLREILAKENADLTADEASVIKELTKAHNQNSFDTALDQDINGETVAHRLGFTSARQITALKAAYGREGVFFQNLIKESTPKAIAHHIATADYTSVQLKAIAQASTSVAFQNAVNAHANIDTHVNNLTDSHDYRKPFRVQAAKKLLGNLLPDANNHLDEDNQATWNALAHLATLPIAEEGEKEAFRDALKNGADAAALLGLANNNPENAGVVDALFEDPDYCQTVSEMAKQKLDVLRDRLNAHITQVGGEAFTSNELLAIAQATDAAEFWNAVNLHNCPIAQNNLINTPEFRQPFRVLAAEKALESIIDGVANGGNNRNPEKRAALLELVLLDKEAFCNALKSDGKARELLGLPVFVGPPPGNQDIVDADNAMVDAMFAGDTGDTLYEKLSAKAKEKIFTLAVDKYADKKGEHLYHIASWESNVEGYQSTLAGQINQANLYLDRKNLSNSPYKELLTEGVAKEVQKFSAKRHLDLVLEKSENSDADINDILCKVAESNSIDDYNSAERNDRYNDEAHDGEGWRFQYADNSKLFANENDFKAKKKQAIEKMLAHYTRPDQIKTETLVALANHADRDEFYKDHLIPLLKLKDAEGNALEVDALKASLGGDGDAGNFKEALQKQVATRIIEQRYLSKMGDETQADYLDRLKAIAGIETPGDDPANFRNHFTHDPYKLSGVTADRLLIAECNQLRKEAAFKYFQGKIDALQPNIANENADAINQKLGLARWIARQDGGNFSSIANAGDPAGAFCDTAHVKTLLNVAPDKNDVNAGGVADIVGGGANPEDTRLLKWLDFSAGDDEKLKTKVLHNAARQAAHAAIRSMLNDAHGQGKLIALKTALNRGGNIKDALAFEDGDNILHQDIRNLFDGDLNTPEMREALKSQTNTALFEKALLSANAVPPVREVTAAYTGHRLLVERFAQLSATEQDTIIGRIYENDGSLAENVNLVFRKVAESDSVTTVESHLRELGFATKHIRPDVGKNIAEVIAKGNADPYKGIYNKKIAEVLRNNNVNVTPAAIKRLNELFFDNGVNPVVAKTADQLVAPAGDNGFAAYKQLIGNIYSAINQPAAGINPVELERLRAPLYDAFGIDRNHGAYNNGYFAGPPDGANFKDEIRTAQTNSAPYLTKLKVAENLAGAVRTQQPGKKFIEFLIAQDPATLVRTDNGHALSPEMIEALGTAFDKAENFDEFKKFLGDYANAAGYVQANDPFILQRGEDIQHRAVLADIPAYTFNGRDHNMGVDQRAHVQYLPDVLTPGNPAFCLDKTLFNSLKIGNVSKLPQANNSDTTRKQEFKNFRDDIFDKQVKAMVGEDLFAKLEKETSPLFFGSKRGGYTKKLEELINNPDGVVVHILPGHQIKTGKKNFWGKSQQDQLSINIAMLKRDLKRFNNVHAQAVEIKLNLEKLYTECEAKGYSEADLEELKNDIDAKQKDIELLDRAMKAFEKGLKDALWMKNNETSATAKGFVIDKGKDYDESEMAKIAREHKHGEDIPAHLLVEDTVTESSYHSSTDFRFDVTTKPKAGKIRPIQLIIPKEDGSETKRGAIVQRVPDSSASSHYRDRLHWSGEPSNPEEANVYTYTAIAHSVMNMEGNLGDKHPLLGTPYRLKITQRDPVKAERAFAAACYMYKMLGMKIDPNNIVVNCPRFNPKTAGLYQTSWTGKVTYSDRMERHFAEIEQAMGDTSGLNETLREVLGVTGRRTSGGKTAAEKGVEALQKTQRAFDSKSKKVKNSTKTKIEQAESEPVARIRGSAAP